MDKAEILAKLRGSLAYSYGVAPYLVFNDQTMELLLKEKPTTVQQLATLKGFPPEGKRVANWGEAIVSVFADKSDKADFKVTATKDGEFLISRVKMMNSFG